ncbi:MAG TPA: hypothetical protein VF666_19980 [Pyrinomonadaceae bacterium]|jgi:ElaB/YqjD/DUF883 family membrane-anchored ribosome-binding protein
MTEHERDDDAADAPTADAPNPTKAQLQRQMEEARESISETVSEIKETVANQYDEVKEKIETVKESVSEVLDWREQFIKNPIAWGAGAVSVGILIGIGISRTVEHAPSSRVRGRGKSEGFAIADLLLEKLSGIGDAVLPTISGSLKEMFGVDLADYLHQTPEPKKLPARRKSSAKKTTAQKSTTKRRSNATKKTSVKRQGTKQKSSPAD